MRNIILAAAAFTAFAVVASAARADDFGGQRSDQPNGAAQAYLDQQASNSGLSDPTAPNSIRSHGNH